MTTEASETPVQPALTAKQSGQNPRSAAVEAASVAVVKDNVHEEPTDYYHQLIRFHEPPWYGTVCPVV